MSPPDVKTVTDALRAESRMWDEQSDALSRLSHTVEGLRISRLEAGMFQIVFSAYEQAIDQISQRCEEGNKRTQEIASALIRNAKSYDENEEETTQHVENAY